MRTHCYSYVAFLGGFTGQLFRDLAVTNALAQTASLLVAVTLVPRTGAQASATAGLAFRSAALQTGHYEALRSIAVVLREQAPELARALGLDDL